MKMRIDVRLSRLIGLATVFLFVVIIIVLILLDDKRVFESSTLLTVLNALLITATSLTTAVLAILGYIRIGLWRFLALAAGSMAFGLTAILAGPLMRIYGPDIPITIYNVGSLLAAMCFSASIINIRSISMNNQVPIKRIITASLTLVLTLVFIGIIVVLSVQHRFPPFFIQGSGSTPIRQIILGLVITLLGGTALLVFRDYLETRTGFNFWFALGLFCIAAGFTGVYTMTMAGNTLNWVARFSQYLGNVYLFGAVVISVRKINSKSKASEEMIAAFLQEAGLNYRLIMDTDPNGIAVINNQGGIISWNRQAERILGYISDEAVGSSLVNLILPSEGDAINRALKTIQESTRTMTEAFTAEFVAYCKNGSTRPVSFSLSGTKTSFGWMGVVTINDITERKKAEAEITHLASFPQLNPNPILELDESSHIIYANPQSTMLFPELFTLDSKHPFLSEIYPWIEKGERQQVMVDVKINDAWFEQTLIYIPNMHIYRLYARDITSRKQAEEKQSRYAAELEASNKELEAFAYALSHDLRAPLRTLDGFSQAVLEDYGDKLDFTGKDYLSRIRGSAQHMARITEDMLKLSRVIRSELQLKTIDLSDMVSAIAKELSEKETGRKISFSIAQNIVIIADPDLLQIALYNILDNACKYTAKNPDAKIEFSTFIQDDVPVYFIKDNGIGFDMRYNGKLFQPFQRLNSDKDFPGTGIGLATVQRVIKRHGGKIWIESELGKGTIVYFSLGLISNH